MRLRCCVPGDKSIAHRALILGALAEGTSTLRGLPFSDDVRATARALRHLGADFPSELGAEVQVAGPSRWRDAPGTIDCGNSGTTARLLTGLIAGLGVGARLDGDDSLRGRPMDRVVYPLQAMGADITYAGAAGVLPLRIEARATGSLRPLRHRARMASAQVKSALLLAGVAGRVSVEVNEPGHSRDHTERMLMELGAPLERWTTENGACVHLQADDWSGTLRSFDMKIPGDPSSAAFHIAAALLAGHELTVTGVALNRTRAGFLAVLREMGASVEVRPTGAACGEPVGDIEVRPAPLRPFDIGAERIPALLDEIPVLVALATRIPGTSRVRGAGELRLKESDRLQLLAENLDALGAHCRQYPDGLEIEGSVGPLRGRVRTGGDHRIAMAFGVLSRLPDAEIEIDDPACTSVSYPGFWHDLDAMSHATA